MKRVTKPFAEDEGYDEPSKAQLIPGFDFEGANQYDAKEHHWTSKGLEDMLALLKEQEEKFVGKLVRDRDTNEVGMCYAVVIPHPVDGMKLIVRMPDGDYKWLFPYKAEVVVGLGFVINGGAK